MTHRVLNRHHTPKPEGVYIGRGSPFGNPFRIGEDGTREEVIEAYREVFYAMPELQALARKKLLGKDLVCYCAPLPCHGDVIAEYLDSLQAG